VKVEVIRAWPRGFESRVVELAEGATVADAEAASGFDMDEVAARSVFGVRVDVDARLHDGDRLELLRPLLADPKDARRKRAAARNS
jgi:uncharacterized protein